MAFRWEAPAEQPLLKNRLLVFLPLSTENLCKYLMLLKAVAHPPAMLFTAQGGKSQANQSHGFVEQQVEGS